ncbi:hypothetical protein [Actinokineospora xionganensis]|uniref:Lipoprotein LprG n=1 Tax=Actinokineospora xionganensis TaxID=2684470 RepID=A0ABR7L7J0_9PSEU|nr:hypothetical protein [Actinokineospora xionganensis]MBC6448369.1 hypothetical protein [Actinokineospora xionganensis]
MRKTTLLVCGAALAALTLTACNSATPSTGTSGAGTSTEAKPTKSGFDSLKALSDAVTEKSDGEKSAHFKFTGEAGGQKLEGEGDFNFAGEKTAMQMTMSTPEGDITMRFLDNVIYMKMPQPLEPGKPWLKIDLADKDNPMVKAMGGSVDSMKNADPRQTLKQLADAGEIKSSEEVELDGKSTTHYKILVDTSKLKGSGLGMDEQSIAAMEKAGIKEMPVEVWVDEENLPVRFVVDVPGKGGASSKVQADYSDWGKAVKVEAPPAAEVAEMPGS